MLHATWMFSWVMSFKVAPPRLMWLMADFSYEVLAPKVEIIRPYNYIILFSGRIFLKVASWDSVLQFHALLFGHKLN